MSVSRPPQDAPVPLTDLKELQECCRPERLRGGTINFTCLMPPPLSFRALCVWEGPPVFRCKEVFRRCEECGVPCWSLWRWSPGQPGHWSPAPTGSGCQSVATPPPPCRSETHPGKSVDADLRIIHSERTSSAERRRTSGPGSRSCRARRRPAGSCWELWRRRWGHRWSSCAWRITP